MNHVTYERVMSNVNESGHTRMSHVADSKNTNLSLIIILFKLEVIRMSHVQHERVMSHTNETHHV